MMTFKDLGLSAPILKAVQKKGYTEPSPIQAKAIPLVLERKDVLASAQTGTGKTAGFTLPMLQIISQSEKRSKRPIKALVLTPTRELAAQILANVKEYSEFLDIKSTVVFGGVNAKPQIRTLRQGVDILVATPGRLLDLHSQKVFTLANIEFFVLDEADRMLDMGFARDINKIMALLPKRRQNLLFSATFSKEIRRLANQFLHNPVSVEVAPQNATAEMVIQKAYRVDMKNKIPLIIKMITEGNWKQVLVFTRTKHRANKLSKKMVTSGISAAAIHGNKSQGARTKALAGFKKGDIRVLVATDIAARGLDIPLLPHVVNFELPNVPEDYVHRIGRTGRAGASGEAISLVSIDELPYVKSIEKLLGQKLAMEIIEGFEPTETEADIPKKKPNSGRGRGGNSRSSNSKNSNRNRNRNRSSSNHRGSGGDGANKGNSGNRNKNRNSGGNKNTNRGGQQGGGQ